MLQLLDMLTAILPEASMLNKTKSLVKAPALTALKSFFLWRLKRHIDGGRCQAIILSLFLV